MQSRSHKGHRDTRPLSARMTRSLGLVLACALLAGSLSFAPSAALASKLGSDRVGGYRVSSSRIATSTAPDITAKSGALVAGNRVLWSRKLDSQRAMASTTKIMTALLVLENCGLKETVTITKTAARTPYATGLRTGERRSVRKLLELTLVASSNDAANALAIHVAGSRKGFAKRMNARAKQLGMTNTRFVNAHGLDAKGHYSSAADLTTLMRAAIKHPEFKRIIKMRSVKLPRYKKRGARTIRSTDKLLGQVSGLRGGKTGFTNDARYCFVSSARRDGVTLTAVVLGASNSSARFTSSKRLLTWGFKYYRIRTLGTAGQTVGTASLSGGPGGQVGVKLAKTVSVPVMALLGPVARTVELQPVAAPVKAGDKVGTVRYIQGSEVIASTDAVAAASVAASATP